MTPLPLPGSPPLHVRSVSRSHVGRVRRLNEDRVLDSPAASLWAVADGMGGHAGGAAAAERVIDALGAVPHGASGPAFLADVADALQAANRALQEADGGGGSTVVALLIHDGHHACIWAGDSRAYRWRDGRLERLTRDHSVVQDMVDRGTLTESERRRHPNANVITRAVGIEPRLRLERHSAAVASGDLFLLCSDGLTGCVEESEIADLLAGGDLGAAADALLRTALDRGAPDNVSLVLVALSGG